MAGCTGVKREVARERGCVREVAGKSACLGGSGRGGVCGGSSRCLRSSSSSFLCRDGVLGCAGVRWGAGMCGCAGVCWGVLGFHVLFFFCA